MSKPIRVIDATPYARPAGTFPFVINSVKAVNDGKRFLVECSSPPQNDIPDDAQIDLRVWLDAGYGNPNSDTTKFFNAVMQTVEPLPRVQIRRLDVSKAAGHWVNIEISNEVGSQGDTINLPVSFSSYNYPKGQGPKVEDFLTPEKSAGAGTEGA